MARDKLKRVNVPEKFYSFFLKSRPPGNSTLLQKLAATAPTKRGRGFSRVLDKVTEDEWNELYVRAVAARSRMQGADDRKTELVGAICAKILCERMEERGVDNPQPYVPSRTVTRTPKLLKNPPPAAQEESDESDTDLSSEATTVVPGNLTVQQVSDVDAADDEDLSAIGNDIALVL